MLNSRKSLHEIRRLIPFILAVVAATVIFAAWLALPRLAVFASSDDPVAANPAGAVRTAWTKANALQQYEFHSELAETTYPAASLQNAGRPPQTQQLTLIGTVNLPEDRLDLRLWQNSGSIAAAESGIEVRILGDQAFGRVPGGEWEEIPDISDAFAPADDPLAYLAGAIGFDYLGESDQGGVHLQRVGFDLDGHAFAAHVRSEMEAYLRQRGRLPVGLSLAEADTYRNLQGKGEVWIDDQGYPRRLQLDLLYPVSETGEGRTATILTHLNGFAAEPAAERAWFEDLESTGLHLNEIDIGFILAAVAALIVLGRAILHRRTARLQKMLAAFLILSFLVSPLLAAGKAQANDGIDPESGTTGDGEASVALDAAERWDPTQSPLLAGRTAEAMAQAQASLPASIGSVARPDYQAIESAADDDLDGLADPIETFLGSLSTSGDSDEDGLTDGEEALFLGTSPADNDSDGDGLSDFVEVQGFQDQDDRTLYANPINADTNQDGIADGLECPALLSNRDGAPSDSLNGPAGERFCQDSDGDGTPDILDADNDGDGVDDAVDLSPFSAGETTYAGANPFRFRADGLTPGKPVFLELQLRPTDLTHLTFARNVLDWPAGDTRGQIQRVFTTTLGQNGPGQNGDMILVPMLEVTIPTQYQNQQFGNLPALDLPVDERNQPDPACAAQAAQNGQDPAGCLPAWIDQDPLNDMGVAVKRLDSDGTMMALVPLNVVGDASGGGRQAFSALMPYLPNETGWGTDQEIRVVWLVQALTDQCTPVPEEPAFLSFYQAVHNQPFSPREGDETQDEYEARKREAWCAVPDNWQQSREPQLVHAYYESWQLAGLELREEHGLDMAVAFQEPGYDPPAGSPPASLPDEWLWLLARGLEAVFVNGLSEDGARVLTVHDIKPRFDPLGNGTTLTQTWGIPDGAIGVREYQLPHSYAIGGFIAEETARLLDETFPPMPDGGRPTPTLVFARETRLRSLNLDDAGPVDSTPGIALSVESDLAIQTIAQLSWSTYRFNQERQPAAWDNYPVSVYWDYLEAVLKADPEFAPESGDRDARWASAGKIRLIQAQYLTYNQGLVASVEIGDLPTPGPPEPIPESSIANIISGSGSILGDVAQDIAEKATVSFITWQKSQWRRFALPGDIGVADTIGRLTPRRFMASIGEGIQDSASGFFNRFRPSKMGDNFKTRAQSSVGTAVMLTTVALTIWLAAGPDSNTALILSGVINGIELVEASVTLVQTARTGATASHSAVRQVSRAAKAAAVVGFIIAVGVSWGLFVAQIVENGAAFWSLAFNDALAGTVAATVTAALMLAIAFIPVVGQILLAIVAIVDALVFLVCNVALEDVEKSEAVDRWVCGGLTGLVNEVIKWTIYGQNVLVELDPDQYQRLEILGIEQSPANASQGYAVGNSLAVSTTVQSNIRLSPFPIDWKAALYFWQHSNNYLIDSSVGYNITSQEETAESRQLHQQRSLALGQQRSSWNWNPERDYFTQNSVAAGQIPIQQAGINEQLDIYLGEGYSYPAQECWGWPFFFAPLAVCYIRAFADSSYLNIGNNTFYDVFPATLSGFYELEEVPVPASAESQRLQYRQSWGGDMAFPALLDADGDGLVWNTDVNDSRWDSDGDGWSDLYESQSGTDPENTDSDGDDLNDASEALFGSDPRRSDSDGDGLTDKEEIEGWLFVYGRTAEGLPARTHVTSDPLSADADGDGFTDFQEKLFGTHPAVFTLPNVFSFTSAAQEELAPQLLLRFADVEVVVDEDTATIGLTQSERQAYVDSSGRGLSATCTEPGNCPAPAVAGRYGAGLVFDEGQFIAVPELFPGGEAWSTATIAAWVNPNEVEEAMLVLALADEATTWASVGYDGASSRFYYQDGTGDVFSTTAAYSSTQWLHVSLVMTDTTSGVSGQLSVLPVDNSVDVLAAQSAFTSTTPVPFTSTTQLFIGGSLRGNSFQGAVDEIAVYDRALSPEQLYRLAAGRYNPDDRFLAKGDVIGYQATVHNELAERQLTGAVYSYIGSTENISRTAFALNPGADQLFSGRFVVTGTHSGSQDLTVVGQTAVTDRWEDSALAELWLRLDSLANGVARDSSGSSPPRNFICKDEDCPEITGAGVFGGYAATFDGADQLTFEDANEDAQTAWLEGQGDRTLCTWLQPASAEGNGWLVDSSALSLRQDGRNLVGLLGTQNQVISSEEVLTADQWHHACLVYDAPESQLYIYDTPELQLYLDGRLVAEESASDIEQDDSWFVIGSSRDDAPNGWQGRLDDLRYFSRALDAGTIQWLYHRPVIDFPDGPASNGTGSAFPRLPVDASLEAGYTVAVWVKPEQPGPLPQGILGDGDMGTAQLLLDGSDVIWQHEGRLIAQETILFGVWNQIVVTYDPDDNLRSPNMSLFVNGVLAAERPLLAPLAALPQFIETGRATSCFTVRDLSLGLDNPAPGHELGLRISDGARVFSMTLPAGQQLSNEGPDQTFCETANLNVTALAVTTTTETLLGTRTISHDHPYTQPVTLTFAGPITRTAAVTFTVENPSLPLQGELDEVALYARPFSPQEVESTFRRRHTVAAFAFDDRPGASGFSDALGGYPALCLAEEQCPVAGEPGRFGSALFFDGADAVMLDRVAEALRQNGPAVVSLWVRPAATDPAGIVWQFDGDSGPSLTLRYTETDGGEFRLQGGDDEIIAPNLPPDRWYEIAVTFSEDRAIRLYVDGQLMPQELTLPATPLTQFRLGSSTDSLQGWLDALWAGRRSTVVTTAPLVHITFDGSGTTDSFPASDSDGQMAILTGTRMITGGQGIRASAIRLDGNAVLQLRDTSLYEGENHSFTALLWFRADDADEVQTLMSSESAGWRIDLNHGQLALQHGDRELVTDSDQLLASERWYLLGLRFSQLDGNEGIWTILVNGQPVASAGGMAPSGAPDDLILGSDGTSASFAGVLDDLQIYGYDLSSQQIRAFFAYVGSLIDQRNVHPYLLDVDEPQSELITKQRYWRNEPVILHVQADDPTSAISLLELGVRMPDDILTWTSAFACSDRQSDSAWCPRFVPQGEGQYELYTRATDQAGNREQTLTQTTDLAALNQTIYLVDTTAPTATIALSPNGDRIRPLPDQTREAAWLVPLSGLVSDGLIQDTSLPGSGVARLQVTLFDVSGQSAGLGPQVATIITTTGQITNSWEMDYRFTGSSPTGVYRVQLEVVDAVGNRRQIEAANQAYLDAAPPEVVLDGRLQMDATAVLTGGGPILSGNASDIGPSVGSAQQVASLEFAFQSIMQGSPSRNRPLPASTLLYLPLDESGAGNPYLDPDSLALYPYIVEQRTFADYSGRDREATCTVSLCPRTGEQGVTGQALAFAPENQIELGSVPVTDTFTVALWIRPENIAAPGTILGVEADDGGFSLRFSSSSIQFGTTETYAQANLTAEDNGRWQHLAAVYMEGRWQLYVNGTIARTASGATLNLSDAPWRLGTGQDGNGFRGQLDEFAIFGEALNQATIQELLLDQPILHLPFDEQFMVDGRFAVDAGPLSYLGQLQRCPDGDCEEAGPDLNRAVPGQVGDFALALRGGAEQVSVAEVLDWLSARKTFSLGGWFNLADGSEEGTLIQLGRQGPRLTVTEDQIHYSPVTGQQVTLDLPARDWVYIAVIQEANLATLYLATLSPDGAVLWLDEDTVTGPPSAIGGDLTIGPLSGVVDDLVLYPYALQPDEIAGHVAAAWRPATLVAASDTISATWTAPLPEGLEGFYEIWLRATDDLGNLSVNGPMASSWRGFVDTRPPRIDVDISSTGTGQTAMSQLDIHLEDFSLAEPFGAEVETPCPLGTYQVETYDSIWFRALGGQTTAQGSQPFALSATCRVPASNIPANIRASDRFGNVAVRNIMPTTTGDQAGRDEVAIFSPRDFEVIRTAETVTISGAAQAAAGIETITATLGLESIPIPLQSTAGLTSTLWSLSWTPRNLQGPLPLEVTMRDGQGDIQTTTTTLLIDALAPELAITPMPLTSTNVTPLQQLVIGGHVSDDTQVTAVHVAVNNGDSQSAQLFESGAWQFYWPFNGREIDDETIEVAVTARDLAGRSTTGVETLRVDVVPPRPSLLAGRLPVGPGSTIDPASGLLRLNWEEPAGSERTEIIWRQQQTQTLRLERLVPAGTNQAFDLPEGSANQFALVSRDALGNERREVLSQIYADGPLTPDFITDLDYTGWMNPEQTLLGVNRQVAMAQQDTLSRSGVQQLYASWDAAQLRLSWTGADWSQAGTLYYYLDTVADSGCQTVRNASSDVRLPPHMQADFVVAINDNRQLELWRCQSAQWQPEPDTSRLAFAIQPATTPARTDLLLPFDAIGLESNTAVQLLAVALNDEGEIWATMPPANPITDPDLAHPQASPYLVPETLTLRQSLHWPSMGAGMQPNMGYRPQAELGLSLTAEPQGFVVGYLSEDLNSLADFTAGRWLSITRPLEDQPLSLDLNPPALQDGQHVTYTLTLQNQGSSTLEEIALQMRASANVVVEAARLGNIRLPFSETDDGVLVLAVPALAPDSSRKVTVSGRVRASALSQTPATVQLNVLADDLIMDWYWAQHSVMTGTLQAPLVHQESNWVGPITNTLRGEVLDFAGIGSLELAYRPAGAGTEGEWLSLPCDLAIRGNEWSCDWRPPEGVDRLDLRVQATDEGFRQRPASEPITLDVDRTPPDVTLTPRLARRLESGLATAAELATWSGQIGDNYAAAEVTICLEDQCTATGPRDRLGADGDWELNIPWTLEEGTTYTFTLSAADVWSNRLDARVFQVEVLAEPAIVVEFNLSEVRLADYLAPAEASQPVLGGRIDGLSPLARFQAIITRPDGHQETQTPVIVGHSWSLTPRFTHSGRYLIELVLGEAGRRETHLGPYTVQVSADPTRVTTTYLGNDIYDGAQISLELIGAPADAWTTLEWQDNGRNYSRRYYSPRNWHPVSGWEGTPFENGVVIWWVGAAELDGGLFRWLIFGGPNGELLAVSETFTLPAKVGQHRQLSMTF